MKSQTVFRFCPRCGAPGFTTPDGKVHVCEGCGLHFYRNITSAVAGLVLDSTGRLLLIRREREPAKGKLGFPGGFIDAGESAEEALRREIFEETDLRIEAAEFLISCPNIYTYRGVDYDVLDIFFVCRVGDFQSARAKDEVAGLCVLRAGELDVEELAFPSMRRAFQRFCALSGGQSEPAPPV